MTEKVKKADEEKVRINFLITKDERDSFKRACMRNESQMTDVLVDFVRDYIKRSKK
ncbi:plasmid partition protein ParG [uncultured Methylophaga sp.]|uniref:plasmid partition protein ParG n=1 Tax=uncultured Methylophaga sp. TaxID=285271 RepID=UPI00263187A1|nr:plasmid partition protein ParG [uncultured Methylophaga sp.]